MKYSYPFLIYNVNSFRTHNEGNRPFVEAKSQNQTLALIEKMLKMFSVRSIDENTNNDTKLLLKNFTFDTKNYLDTCPDALPANFNSGVLSDCVESSDDLLCTAQCSGDTSLLSTSSNSEARCSCKERIGEVYFNVPCYWSGLPICSAPSVQVTASASKCGHFREPGASLACDGDIGCALKCDHGYLASDENGKMLAQCKCNKTGRCNWNISANCQRKNQIPFQCDEPFSLIGKSDCTGLGHGDYCSLYCPKGFSPQQYGIQQCICDDLGACDWLGDGGRCVENLEIAGLEEIGSLSLLSAAECDQLPKTKQGKWRCENGGKKCSLMCEAGLEPNKNVEIICQCENGECLYSYQSRFGRLDHIEELENFECQESVPFSEDESLERCSNLPQIQNGKWICKSNGTCALQCLFGPAELVVVDCLSRSALEINFSSLSCSGDTPAKIIDQAGSRSIMKLHKKSKSLLPSKVKERLLF